MIIAAKALFKGCVSRQLMQTLLKSVNARTNRITSQWRPGCDGKEEAYLSSPFPPHPAPAVRFTKTTRSELAAAFRDAELGKIYGDSGLLRLGVTQKNLALAWSQKPLAGNDVDHRTASQAAPEAHRTEFRKIQKSGQQRLVSHFVWNHSRERANWIQPESFAKS